MPTADDVASVIVTRSVTFLTSMQLQKLLYYVQAWHVAITDEPLFNERIKAWAQGPVVPQVWHLRKETVTRSAANQNVTNIDLGDLGTDLIDMVMSAYGSMSGDELSALTHIEIPWKVTRGDLPEDAQSTDEIPLDLMADFYREHRQLGGRTAADLAAGGVYLRKRGHGDAPIDVDAILASLDDGLDSILNDGESANLAEPRNYEGVRTIAGRALGGA